MALDQAANFVVDELQSSVSDTATTLSVADASQFPDPANGEFNLVVFDATRPSKDPDVEVVRVTGRDTTNDELTVTRGKETTTAASHASGTAVELSYTAKFRDDIQTELDNAGGVNIIAPQSAVEGEEPTVAEEQEAIAIGNQASSETSGVAIGHEAKVTEEQGVAIGDDAEALEKGVAVGNLARTTGYSSEAVAVGQGSNAAGFFSIAIGENAKADGSESIAIGSSTTYVATDYTARIGTKQTVIGAVDGGQIADADLNNSELTFELDEANSNIVFRVKNSSGTVKTGKVSLS